METTQETLIRLGHSPDPDDAFMFYALAEEKIPSDGFKVEHVIEDIESLNQRALRGELEVTAVSCHAYAHVADKYIVMRSGCSMGDKYGPILVEKTQDTSHRTQDTSHKSQDTRHKTQDTGHKAQGPEMPGFLKGKRVAIPGKLTTAYLLLQLYEKDFQPVFIPFDQIFEALQEGKADYGLIIHEGQITYQQKGFQKVIDLGEWWYAAHQLPLPLGVDVIRRDLGPDRIQRFARLFKASIEYALQHREPALKFAQAYGRGISDELNDRFVGMYVNDYTVDMGEKGMAGFRKLMEEGHRQGILPAKISLDFV